MARRHSQPPRGLAVFEKSETEPARPGRFGRLFDADDEQLSPDVLTRLAKTMEGDGPDADNSIVDEDFEDENHNLQADGTLRISAGYTYLSQFIDHDLTFDPTSTLEAEIDPAATVNFRSPRLDLDCVYGSGPDDQPYLYEDDGQRLLEGSGGDVLRYGQRALIGDPRNDENHVVVQWHRIMVRFHNKVVGWLAHDRGIKSEDRFRSAQKLVRWTYQWLIVNDFLPRILRTSDWEGMVEKAQAEREGPFGKRMRTQFGDAFMPVEFSGAAYRFGHSMVRPSYHLNDSEVKLRDGGHGAEGGNRVPIFDVSEPNLNGFRPFAQPFSTVPLLIEWKYFFRFTDKENNAPMARNVTGVKRDQSKPPVFDTVETTHDVLQPAYRIDTSITEPLSHLDIPGVANNPPNLAERNLRRGGRLRLPSGQKIASVLGIPLLTKKELLLEPGPDADEGTRGSFNNEFANRRVKEFSGDEIESIAKTTPLWYYILAEAQMQEDSASLGRVGTALVGGVFLDLLWTDKQSYLHHRDFDPAIALHLPEGLQLKTVADLIKLVAPESVGRMGVLNI